MTTARGDRPAGYSDIEELPENVVGEIVDGELNVSPRPAPRHAVAASNLGATLNTRYRVRQSGSGSTGWWILDEPELHLGEDVVVPDLAGWRVERMPAIPDGAAFTLAPDWICEVLSASTARFDRVKKLPIFARAGVRHAWLLEPALRTLEELALKEGGWYLALSAGGDDKVRAPPFDDVELDLAELWLPDDPSRR